MASFPGPQKTKIETFIYHLYEGKKGQKLSKNEIMPRVQRFEFAPDVQVFFEQLPEGSYDQDSLIHELNRIIESRGRAPAIGGLIEKREQIPPDWEEAYQKIVHKKAA